MKRVAFVLSCAERLFSNYVTFVEYHQWGNVASLDRALRIGWRALQGERVDQRELEECALNCEHAAPNTEDFDSVFVSAALDAANCCLCLMKVLEHNGIDEIIEAATLARDTVDMQIQDAESMSPLDGTREQRIDSHPRMQQELARQRQDLELLTLLELDEAGVNELMRRWRHR